MYLLLYIIFYYIKIKFIQVMIGSKDNLNLYLFFTLHQYIIYRKYEHAVTL